VRSGDALPKLWMERQKEALDEVMRWQPETATLRFDTYTLEDWKREEAIVKRKIADGRFTWPPTKLLQQFPWPDHQFGHYVSPYNGEFDIESLICFGQLPTFYEFFKFRSEEVAALIAYQTYSIMNWRRWGQRVYVLDEDTFEILSRTPLPKFPAHFLEIPIPSFYLKFPERAFQFSVAGDPKEQWAEGVIVTFNNTRSDRSREVTLLITGKSPLNVASDDNISFTSVGLGPDALLSDLDLDQMSYVTTANLQDVKKKVPLAVFGFLLYLQSEHPLVRPVPPLPRRDTKGLPPKKLAKIKEKEAHRSALGYIYVGGEPEHKEIVRRGEVGTGTPLAEGHYRQGHMRWQRFGPKLSQVKHIRIEPTWVGPDPAETMRIHAQHVPTAEEVEDE
jgi:hypothetical protein